MGIYKRLAMSQVEKRIDHEAKKREVRCDIC